MLNLGLQIGRQYYTIYPTGSDYEFNKIKHYVSIITMPFSIKRYFPFNHKHALYVSPGINLSKTFSNLGGFSISSDETKKEYWVVTKINSLPQLGGFLEIGGTYILNNNNFISHGAFINYNLGRGISLKYTYYNQTERENSAGNLEPTDLYFGFKLVFCFKSIPFLYNLLY